MQVKKGYLALENIISIVITGIILTVGTGVLLTSLNIYQKIYSTIEIQQQGMEIQNYIEKELNHGIEVKSVKTTANQVITSDEFDEKDVISIKYKPIDRPISQGLDEIFLNNKTNKVFIKRRNSSSGYEVGDYLDNIYISKLKKGTYISLRLELSKNNQNHSLEFSLDNI
ncbi:MAG: hypothetical protein ACRCXT_20455 [Paraclostridium sp.]